MLNRKLLATLVATCFLAAPAVAQDDIEEGTVESGSKTYLGVNIGALIEGDDTENALTGTAIYEWDAGLVLEYEIGGSDVGGTNTASQDYSKIGWRVYRTDDGKTRAVLGLQRTDLQDEPLYGIFGSVMHDLSDDLMWRAMIDVTDTETEDAEIGTKVGFFIWAL